MAQVGGHHLFFPTYFFCGLQVLTIPEVDHLNHNSNRSGPSMSSFLPHGVRILSDFSLLFLLLLGNYPLILCNFRDILR